jgi:hypothetical protein
MLFFGVLFLKSVPILHGAIQFILARHRHTAGPASVGLLTNLKACRMGLYS